MANSNRYKTFTELKNSIETTSVSKTRLAEMSLDLDNFVKKIKSSKKL